jgi:hypothetical protein
MNKQFAIAWDLDGVHAQFDESVIELTGVLPKTLDDAGILWSTLAKYPSFFADLKPYPEMIELYHEVKDKVGYSRVITGRPRKETFPNSSQHKIDWAKKQLDPNIHVVVCLSKDKQKHMSEDHTHDILIDDRIDNITRWVQAGGIGILHTSPEKTRQTLLRLLGL